MMLRVFLLFILSLFISRTSFAQGDSIHLIKVHFLYGSRPLKKYKPDEKHWFGGIHGGHVSIEVDNKVIGFEPDVSKSFHYVAHRKDFHSHFVVQDLADWVKDTATLKYTSIILPLTGEQYTRLKEVQSKYISETPYDYAFLGMRCAASAYEVLSHEGIFKPRSNFSTVLTVFYPKPLRRKLMRWAKKQNGCVILCKEGRCTRKWEKD
jgi:hypothetical protein